MSRDRQKREARTRATCGPRKRSVRYVVLLALFGSAFLSIGARLVWLQVVEGPAYAKMALEQRQRELDIPPQRGSIYDREGQPLAVSMEARNVYAVPKSVTDPEGAALALASVLGGDKERLPRKAHQGRDFRLSRAEGRRHTGEGTGRTSGSGGSTSRKTRGGSTRPTSWRARSWASSASTMRVLRASRSTTTTCSAVSRGS